MNLDQTHPSVILLMGADSPSEHSMVRNWFEHSRFLTCEAKDVFQCARKISDFTVRERPDVVLLEVDSPADEFALLQSVVDGTSDASEHTIFALNDGPKMIDSDDCFEGNLAQVASRLEGMIPHNMGVSASRAFGRQFGAKMTAFASPAGPATYSIPFIILHFPIPSC